MTDAEELSEYLHNMQREQKDVRTMMTKIMWHMRGSLSRQEAWTLSFEERNDVMKLIEEHRDMTEKTGLALL